MSRFSEEGFQIPSVPNDPSFIELNIKVDEIKGAPNAIIPPLVLPLHA